MKISPRSWFWYGCVWASILTICFAWEVTPARATVTLSYFSASWSNDDVLVVWETSSEIESESFYVQRFESESGNYLRISPLIPAVGEPQSGATYQFVDTDVVSGMDYWYILEAIDENNNSEFFGPVSNNPASLTPTSTATLIIVNTSTPTNTPTSTQAVAPTASSSPTAINTQALPALTATGSFGTAYPAPSTATPQFQPTPSALQTGQPSLPTSAVLSTPETMAAPLLITSTATLIPLPQITLTFPPGGILMQERGGLTSTPAPARQAVVNSPWDPSGGVMLIAVILVIWILLGVWFYLSARRIE